MTKPEHPSGQHERDAGRRPAEQRRLEILDRARACVNRNRHLLAAGVNLAAVAEAMRDLGTLSDADADAVIGRRMTAPSPWVTEFGTSEELDKQAPPSPPRPVAEPLPREVEEACGLRPRWDGLDPCVQAAMAIRYERM